MLLESLYIPLMIGGSHMFSHYKCIGGWNMQITDLRGQPKTLRFPWPYRTETGLRSADIFKKFFLQVRLGNDQVSPGQGIFYWGMTLFSWDFGDKLEPK